MEESNLCSKGRWCEMISKEILELSEEDFITHIVTTICDYAKLNGYEVTDTVKTMGENLVELTKICNLDSWKAGAK